MPGDFLEKIAAEKYALLKRRAAYYENLKKNLTSRRQTRYGVFKKAVSRPEQLNLIAEIKKASPSAGLLREDFEVLNIARIYVEHKAAAISVLTEEKYFLGKLAYLKRVGEEFHVPTLMKDFIVHEYQVYEGALYGACAVLLIAAMLSDAQMKDLMDTAHALGLDCLVEAHDEPEIGRALKAGAEIIGVNNRNLRSLETNVQNCLRLIPRIPSSKIIVAESGLKTREDMRRVREAGAHAVLIGETFMRAENIGAKIEEVMNGQD
ncbi:MAG: indole-3-glycerol phosphate synthase TrpC [Candidatus Omnitrophica bacterium]|nr:indole-3-glycerol phosphate synthase TrpC [Candidatus Omnitrophota bacterium]